MPARGDWRPSGATGTVAPVRVLLMSPVAGVDPPGGDLAFTEALLARPPDGVVYTTYVDALAEGSLVERGRRAKHGRMRPVDVPVLAARVAEHGLRRAGVLFREPYRYLTADPDAYDLVHAHVFPIRPVGPGLPMVTSSGMPLPVLYEGRFAWTHRRAALAGRGERLLSAAVGAEVSWFPPRRAAVTMVQSARYRDHLLAEGADPRRVVVQPVGIEGAAGSPRTGRPTTVGFVATGFDEKGGAVVVEAFRRLVAGHPGLRLLIVGSPARDLVPPLPAGSVDWLGPVPRHELLEGLLARIDVLVLPTPCDSGVPYAVLEAMQRGIPVVASELTWLDGHLRGPGARRVPAAAGPLCAAVGELLDPDVYARASRAVLELWAARYSMEVVAGQIGAVYRAALVGGDAPAGTGG